MTVNRATAGQMVEQTVEDLSMNETPLPPPPVIAELVTAAVGRLNRYPDNAARDLIAALAASLRVPPEQVLTGPGSAGLCQNLIQTLAQDRAEVVHAAPSFEAYGLMIANAGARAVPVPLAGDRHDLPAMAAAITADTRCVLVCNPNNPTGTVVYTDEVKAFLDRVPPQVTVLLDEAYREFVTDPDVPDGVELTREYANLCVLRTFSKAYGLAALRVGYAVASPELAATARRVGHLFFPGSLGQIAATACLRAEVVTQVTARCQDISAERHRFSGTLTELGYPGPASQANFVWLPLGSRSEAFAGHCARAGILVRGYPGLGVRVTIGTRAANERFLAAAADFAARDFVGRDFAGRDEDGAND